MADDTLKNMTNQALWELFPIVLEPYDPTWPLLYEKERDKLRGVLDDMIVAIDHIGSTAVPGLTAKPTIDILMQIDPGADVSVLCDRLRSLDYLDDRDISRPAPHYMFMKGYTPQGFKPPVFHLHVRYPGDYDELYFRDHLRKHPDACAAYVRLKKRLQKRYRHHRDAYTEGKTAFIKKKTLREKNSR